MKTFLSGIILASGLLLTGCDKNGDSGYYDDVYRIYFPKDSLNYNFGDKPLEQERYMVQLPVEILGTLARSGGMKVKVELDEKASTAPVEAYTGIPEEITIPEDSIVGYVPVELVRAGISEEDTVFKLVFHLKMNEDFDLGIKESLRAVVTFSNYLAEPDWWMGLEYYCLGPYQPEKYQKLIELWGGPITLDDFYSSSALIVQKAKIMYQYFQERPEYGMVFPEMIFWPYQ